VQTVFIDKRASVIDDTLGKELLQAIWNMYVSFVTEFA